MNTSHNQISAIIYSTVLALVLGILTYAFINVCAPFIAWVITISLYTLIFIFLVIAGFCSVIGIFMLGGFILDICILYKIACNDFWGTLMLTHEQQNYIYIYAYQLCSVFRAADFLIAMVISAFTFKFALKVLSERDGSDQPQIPVE